MGAPAADGMDKIGLAKWMVYGIEGRESGTCTLGSKRAPTAALALVTGARGGRTALTNKSLPALECWERTGWRLTAIGMVSFESGLTRRAAAGKIDWNS